MNIDLMKCVDDAIALIEKAKCSIVDGSSQPFRFLVHATDYLRAERNFLFEEKWQRIRGQA